MITAQSGSTSALSRLAAPINHRFGTYRGLIRLLLAQTNWRLGFYRPYQDIEPRVMQRLVFVCQGNICRSPFAHFLATSLITDFPIVSIGLATTTGTPADPLAAETAARFSVDLGPHHATDITDFSVQDGDVFAVMEDRHIRALRPIVRGKRVQIVMLGLWSRPPVALLYDPHGLSPDYFYACFGRIKSAVEGFASVVQQ